MSITFDAVSVRLAGAELVHDLNVKTEEGEVLGFVGPNGSGKSTALRCVYGALRPSRGAVLLDGTDLATLDPRASARSIAAVPQESGNDLDFTVAEVVELGRFPHHRGNQPLTAEERAVRDEAMRRADVVHLADRGVLSLSGGERQRVVLARAFAQQPRVLVLDEPTNHLDIHHQLQLLRQLRAESLTVLIAMHDLNLAAATCDRLAVLARGTVLYLGPPAEVLTPEVVNEAFGVTPSIVHHPRTGVPQLHYDI
ncbi:ABC transporter ATP-binding protein [Actinopolyspora erythraea]|uniref:ABC transporter ATP-binding protein n=1 Tax=Actinopolyspora erythraea TaxID=414996 RepID=A0A099D518_9ACTN|nr:ABC transporter ATP-binding protein [Actinopolyspora erythraea]ASU78991.1 ABC transporter ATP-binding protein [Actinopolyspora erythraea]KGI81119.1 ABC transporter ATP-binding protein [Actinopolyspora erythraea]